MKTSIKFTVFFEDMFWVGIFEKIDGEKYSASKVVFGSEPKDYELYDFILNSFYNLKFTRNLLIQKLEEKRINPKRLQRKIKKQTQSRGIGTKAQEAMKLQYEENKSERRKNSRERKDREKNIKFQLHRLRKKEKHRGH
ncbi:YjdF family protein [Clostridium tyrobutyricum]|uniref:YjdF family protein n=1 Tax=Clostridium tyrobutyricum TaxID=1519 RepID=UPI0030CF846A